MSASNVDALRVAAAASWRLLARTLPVLRAMPDEALVAMGIPVAALAACRHRDERAGDNLIARFDFALTADGPKVLECNAETPFFMWESYEIAGAVTTALGYRDPNTGALAALREAIARAVGPDDVRVAVTAYNTWREDWLSAVFAARIATEALGRRVDAVPLHELHVADDAVRDGAGRTIDVLWRFYPTEHLAADAGGPALFALVECGRVRLINPPASLLLQTKAALAVLWHLAVNGVHFDECERADVARLFLPTFLDQPDDGAIYVRKPVLGREGNSIAIVRGTQILEAAPTRSYVAQPVVYQRFVELPRVAGGHAVATCFVLDGRPGPVALRIGGAITDAHARFLPIARIA